MEIVLSKLDWEVKGYWPYVPLKEKSMETGQTLHGVTSWIPAQVPGGVHGDLFRAGMIEDPYYGMNSLKCEWVENRWWMYRVSFPGEMEGRELVTEPISLIFRGLDYEAVVFLNDERLGEHRGMYEPFELDITGKIKKNNQLVVLFKGVPEEMGQIGYTSRTSTQKSRFNYKWDFSTHLVNIGIWQDVILRIREEAELINCSISSDYDGKMGKLKVSAQISDRRLEQKIPLTVWMKVSGPFQKNIRDVKNLREVMQTLNKGVVLEKEWKVQNSDVCGEIEMENPALWYPNGYGEQPLYHVEMQILEEKRVLSSKRFSQGIRSLTLVHNDREHENALPYTFVINGRKVYIKGVNLTPLDHLYGNVREEQYSFQVTAMVNAGVNLVRIWGGGLIEKESLYNLCDENGILVWQEFIQSSSGIDNCPSEDDEYLRLLVKNATAAILEKRNHTALVVYSGGNELMERENTPVSCENRNIALLKNLVEQLDGDRPFLPTSASGPREFVTTDKGVSHDVHGNWRYEGNPGHYRLYGESDNLFHSEFGMDGTSSVKSLQKFLPETALHPTPMSGDSNWQHHGEWWGTYFRDCELFGALGRESKQLPLFAACSQYLQAEGLRFIIESDRRRAFQNSGVIVWQQNEPWPNASCTNLIDYYGETKPAYYQVKRTYETLHVSMDYRNLVCDPDSSVVWPIYLSNSGEMQTVQVRAEVYALDGTLLLGKDTVCDAADNGTVQAMELVLETPKEPMLSVRLQAEWGQGRCSENHYLFGTSEKEILSPLVTSRAKVLAVHEENILLENGRIKKNVELLNSGKDIAVQAGVELRKSDYWILGNDNYITLLPGERRQLEFLLIPSVPGVFEQANAGDKDCTICIHWLGEK